MKSAELQKYNLPPDGRQLSAPRRKNTKLGASLWAHTLATLFALSTLNACLPGEPLSLPQPPDVYRLIFDENGGQTKANPSERLLLLAPYIVGTLPEAPVWEGYTFLGWNTLPDGSGAPFGADTPLNNHLRVYAQWHSHRLRAHISASTLALSLMETSTHKGNVAMLLVEVSGIHQADHAKGLALRVEGAPEWLEWRVEHGDFAAGAKTFALHLRMRGFLFEAAAATLQLSLHNIPADYKEVEYVGETQVRVFVGNGWADNPIPLCQANMEAFNAFANTPDGRTLAYRLVEDVVLKAPVPPETSNWVPIGKEQPTGAADPLAETFTGNFDGDGYTISGLVIEAADSAFQGLFGWISHGAVVKNLGLIDVSVTGANAVGGLVGRSDGTVAASYVTGNVDGEGQVGGLVGYNNQGRVENSYATAAVSGTRNVGGLVGLNNNGRVENSYATGNVSGAEYVGGLLGRNNSTVQNSYATGAVSGDQYVGGLLGYQASNNIATMQTSVALNLQVITTGNVNVGRVTGYTGYDALTDNRARSDMDIRLGVGEDGSGGTAKNISSDADGVDGLSVSAGTAAGQYNNPTFWQQSLGWNFNTVWQWGPNNLPILQGVGGEQNHRVLEVP